MTIQASGRFRSSLGIQNQPALLGKQPRFASEPSAQFATGSDFFCKTYRGELPSRKLVVENTTSFAVLDGYPVGKGHTLVVPKRHFGSLFEATEAEVLDIYRNLQAAKQKLETTLDAKGLPKPDGYNVGVNVGPMGGQTVDHLHVHLIPRYQGDMDDPKGGVRGVIPCKQKYSGPPDNSVNDIYS
jgi:diadenosine tetraphosphate (Ap4A) HIT family hydrolase